MTLVEAQEIVEQHAPKEYYRDCYRGWEEAYLPQAVTLLEKFTPGRIVEVGPGWGAMAVWLKSNGWQVDIVDCVAVGVFMTQELLDKYELPYHHCSLENDDCLPDLQGDVVMMGQVFGHLRYRPDHGIRKASRWLAPGGQFLCHNLDRSRIVGSAEYAYDCWLDMPVPGDGQPVTSMMNTAQFDAAEYTDLLEQCFQKVCVIEDARKPMLFGLCSEPREA